MTNDASWWYVQTVQVKTYLGEGNRGAKFGSPVTIPCWVEDGNKDVINASGEEVVSSARVYADTTYATAFQVGTQVVLPGGNTTRVIAVSRNDSGSLGLGLDHIEVSVN